MRKINLKVLLVFLLVASASTEAARYSETFAEGNKLFRAKEYDQAIKIYSSILDSGYESASLYYNLGNAYFKNGNLGMAVVNYSRARRLDPQNDDVKYNLEFAQSFASVRMEGVKLNPVRALLEETVQPFRLNTLAWITSVFFISLFLLLSMRFGLGMRGAWIRISTIVSFFSLLILSSLTTIKYHDDFIIERAVLIAEQCPIYSGPTDSSEVEFEGAPGLVVEILSKSGEYFNVEFENQRRGWIKTTFVAII